MYNTIFSIIVIALGVLGLISVSPPEGKEILYEVLFFVMIGYGGIRLMFSE